MRVRYFCKYCKALNEITKFWAWFWIPHVGASKYLRCRECGKLQVMPRADGLKFIDWPVEKK